MHINAGLLFRFTPHGTIHGVRRFLLFHGLSMVGPCYHLGRVWLHPTWNGEKRNRVGCLRCGSQTVGSVLHIGRWMKSLKNLEVGICSIVGMFSGLYNTIFQYFLSNIYLYVLYNVTYYEKHNIYGMYTAHNDTHDTQKTKPSPRWLTLWRMLLQLYRHRVWVNSTQLLQALPDMPDEIKEADLLATWIGLRKKAGQIYSPTSFHLPHLKR